MSLQYWQNQSKVFETAMEDNYVLQIWTFIII